MVLHTKAADSLKTIGLNKYERNLWIALLARNSATAGELADISKVPRSRCYDVLESLADKGFVILQPGKPIRYVAVQPREALERAKKHVQNEATEMCTKIERLAKSDALRDLDRIFKEGFETIAPEELSGSLRGKSAAIEQMESMLKKAKKYAKLITTEQTFHELADHHGPLFQRIAKNGVKVHILAPLPKGLSENGRTLLKHAQVRDLSTVEHLSTMASRMCIIDGEEALLGLTDEEKTHETQHVAFWTQSRHVSANTLEPMFNFIWTAAKPVK